MISSKEEITDLRMKQIPQTFIILQKKKKIIYDSEKPGTI